MRGFPLFFSGLQGYSPSIANYWWHIGKVATNNLRIGGTSAKLPPIFFRLVGHQQSCHQYLSDWRHISKVATNIFQIGGTSEKLPPIFIGLAAHQQSCLQ
ncbi:hypothetical protein [Tetragenococcus halophilus]|uniref:hypothetical protein n=1 Tax=Tetragenococcus halophilus TaxID=51669 RepID=UPI0010E3893B